MANPKDVVYDTLFNKFIELEKQDKELDAKYLADKQKLKDDLASLTEVLKKLKGGEPIERTKLNNHKSKDEEVDLSIYPITGSLNKKADFIIRESNRFLKLKEISDYILKKEPNVTNVLALNHQLGKAIYKFRGSGKIVAYKVNNSVKNAFYGYPEWLDEKGEVLPEYMYDKNMVLGLEEPYSDSIQNTLEL